MGRKKNSDGGTSMYDDIDLNQVRILAQKGWIDMEMAEFFGLGISTWHKWKRDYPEFADSLKEWKDTANEVVERALFQRAIGSSHPDVSVTNFQGTVTITDITRHYPPDTKACNIWLKNRAPERWIDQRHQEINLTGSVATLLQEIDGKGRGLPED